MKEQVGGEFAPAEFGQEFIGAALEARLVRGGAFGGGADLRRRNFAEVQMWRESRCAVGAELIAGVGIMFKMVG